MLGEWFGPRIGIGIGAVVLALAALPMLTRRIRSMREPEVMQDHEIFQKPEPVKANA